MDVDQEELEKLKTRITKLEHAKSIAIGIMLALGISGGFLLTKAIDATSKLYKFEYEAKKIQTEISDKLKLAKNDITNVKEKAINEILSKTTRFTAQNQVTNNGLKVSNSDFIHGTDYYPFDGVNIGINLIDRDWYIEDSVVLKNSVEISFKHNSATYGGNFKIE